MINGFVFSYEGIIEISDTDILVQRTNLMEFFSYYAYPKSESCY